MSILPTKRNISSCGRCRPPEPGWPDQKFKNQKIFSQNQKRSERFFEKSETNQKKKFPVKWSVLC
jgi:hypothetical protein